MFNYDDVIEYVDSTYSEEFAAAEKWAKANGASLVELVDRRKKVESKKTRIIETVDDEGNPIEKEEEYTELELHRFFEIKKNAEPTTDELAAQKRAERDALLVQTDKFVLSDYPITEEKLAQYKAYRQYLRDLPTAWGFPNVEIMTFEQYVDLNK